MPSSGFEPAVPASERPQTYALERAATGIGDQELPRLKRLALLNSIKHAKTVHCLPSRNRKTRKKVFVRELFRKESFVHFVRPNNNLKTCYNTLKYKIKKRSGIKIKNMISFIRVLF